MMIDSQATNRERPHVAVLRIWTEYDDVPGKPGEVTECHWMEYVKKGSNGASVTEKVRRIEKTNAALWEVVEGSYRAWLKGQEDPVDGTPLAAWPGVNPAQADRLKLIHVRTVEDVAALTDADLDRVGMGARSLRDKARAFIEAKKGSSIVAEAMAEKDRQIAELMQNVADLTATVKDLADRAGVTEKRGPGRPPKAA
jgi:hypothetical protein